MVDAGGLADARQSGHPAADDHDDQCGFKKVDARIPGGVRIFSDDPDFIAKTGLIDRNPE